MDVVRGLRLEVDEDVAVLAACSDGVLPAAGDEQLAHELVLAGAVDEGAVPRVVDRAGGEL